MFMIYDLRYFCFNLLYCKSNTLKLQTRQIKKSHGIYLAYNAVTAAQNDNTVKEFFLYANENFVSLGVG